MKRFLAATCFLLTAGMMQASSLTYSSTFGQNSASVTFTMLTESLLQVTLSNTSMAGAASSSDVLTAVFFDAPDVTLTALSATVTAGAIFNCTNCPAGTTDIGGEWAYARTVNGFSSQAVHLISTVDAGVLTPADLIGTKNLMGTVGVGGIDFGIVGSNTSFGQSAITGSPLVSTQVIFRFDTSSYKTPSAIGTIGFLFGSGTYFVNAYDTVISPEPGTYAMIGLGLIFAGVYGRPKPKKNLYRA